MESEEYSTIRIWTKTLKLLRITAALKEEKMVATLDRLVHQEYERVQKEQSRRSKENGR